MDDELKKHEAYAQKILAEQQKLNHHPISKEPLYPYSPEDYKRIEIVGHTFEDGKYLPVKVFIENAILPAETRKAYCKRKGWFWFLFKK